MRCQHILSTIVFLITCLGVGWDNGAAAQGADSKRPAASSPGESVREDVRALYKDGLTAFQRKDYPAAYKSFVAAWNLQRIPRIAGNLARTELELGKYRDAAEHFAFFLREDKELPQDQRRAFEESLAKVVAKVGRLSLDVKPVGAEIFVDGVAVGVAPLDRELYVEPGRRSIEARFQGRLVTKALETSAGQRSTLSLEVPSPAPPPLPLSVPTEPQTRPFPTRAVVLISGAAVTAIGLGVGIGAGAVALQKQAEQDQCRTEACFNDIEGARHPLAGASLAGFLVGGTAAVGVAVGYLLWKDVPQNASVTLRLSPDGPGLGVRGTW